MALLRELYVENVALIARATVRFGPGLNALTGETGAGKSLVLDALGMALGRRADAGMIRTGCDTARVEAAIELPLADDPTGPSAHPVAARLADLGFTPEEGGLYLLSREVTAGGRSRARINGRLVPVAELARVGEQLVDLHQQDESEGLLRPAVQRELLDSFAGPAATGPAREVRRLWERLARLAEELEQLVQGERQRLHEMDLLRFQLDEIATAALRPGEDRALLEEHQRLSNASRLQELLTTALGLLIEGGSLQAVAARDLTGQAAGALREAASLDPTGEALRDEADGLAEALGALGRSVRQWAERAEPDPQRLQVVTARLEQIEQLKRKYGASIEEVLAFARQGAERLAHLEQSAARTGTLQRELEQLREEYDRVASALSTARREAAAALGPAVARELAELAMPSARFEVLLTSEPDGPSGRERVEFHFSASAGEPVRPLHRIASGGELSRAMLACRTVIGQADTVPVMVFDEPDAGLGGRAAQAVAERLAGLARHRQVLVVTHSPQVASMADHHLVVQKVEAEGRTRVDIRLLEPAERVDELARMVGGARLTETTRRHALELLRLATQVKTAG